MWKDILEYGKQLFALTQSVRQHDATIKEILQEIKELRQEIERLADSLQQLRFEVERDRALAERDKGILQLRLELSLERASKSPSTPTLEVLPPPRD
jgi:predicted RNase H-like nuclease (RuvC/YqgF family)